MSLATWKRKYLPIPAKKCCGSNLEAIEQALRKWEGLRPENLAEHGLLRAVERLVSRRGAAINVGGGQCSLCQMYAKEYGPHKDPCRGCPIAIHLEEGYFIITCNHADSGWYDWIKSGDPQHMIDDLNAAKARLK